MTWQYQVVAWYIMAVHNTAAQISMTVVLLVMVVCGHSSGLEAPTRLATGRVATERDSVVDALIRNWRRLDSIYVEYEVYAPGVNGRIDHKLSCKEAMDRNHHCVTIAHWYIPEPYDLRGRADLDQWLNWRLWTPRSDLQCWETLRRGVVYRSDGAQTISPVIRTYTTYLGKMPPELLKGLDYLRQRAYPIDYSSKEYYLPYALEERGWEPSRDDRNKNIVVLTRKTKYVTDLLTVDLGLGHAIRERAVRSRDGSLRLRIAGADFVEAADGLWLPTRLQTSGGELHSAELRATRLQVNKLPVSVFEKHFPPGTIVGDRQRQRVSVLPGGTDLLDATIERMRLAMEFADQNRHSRATLPMFGTLIGMLVLIASVCAWMKAKVARRCRQ